MSRKVLALALAVALGAIGGAAVTARGGTTGSEAVAARLPTAEFLPLGLAKRAANAALAECRSQGQRVAVTVIDREGVVIVQFRANGVGLASVDGSRGKAYASASFGQPSSALGEAAKTNPGILQWPGFIVAAGGLPIQSGDGVVAGIGVGGAPSGLIDEACAQAGVDALAAR